MGGPSDLCRVFSPASGSGSLIPQLTLPRLLSPGRGTADTCVPRDGFSFPIPPWWSVSTIFASMEPPNMGGQSTEPSSTRQEMGVNRAQARLQGCLPILPTLSWGHPRTEEARKDLLVMLYFSRSQEWNCGESLDIFGGRKMKCFGSWFWLWGITAHRRGVSITSGRTGLLAALESQSHRHPTEKWHQSSTHSFVHSFNNTPKNLVLG